MSEFRLTLKHPSGFFAAGCEMKEALTVLSDGAFKIYVYVCLHADRRTAQLRFRMAELAQATGHSTRSLTSYLEELRRTEVSQIYRAANQHEVGRIEIRDRFWPYEKQLPASLEDPEQALFVTRVRGWFLEPACVQFGVADEKLAGDWYRAGISIEWSAGRSCWAARENSSITGRFTGYQSALLRRHSRRGRRHGPEPQLLAIPCGAGQKDGRAVACSSKLCAGSARTETK